MSLGDRKPPVARRVAAAVLLSLGLHGAIVLGLWFAPVRLDTPTAVAVDPTQVALDYPPLGLDDARRRLRALTRPGSPTRRRSDPTRR